MSVCCDSCVIVVIAVNTNEISLYTAVKENVHTWEFFGHHLDGEATFLLSIYFLALIYFSKGIYSAR